MPLHAELAALRGKLQAISLAYLLSLGVARAVSYDFHVEAFVPLLAFTALWSLVKGSGPMFLISTLAILTLKEDGALLALALCWVARFAFGQRGFVVAAAVAAVVYMLLATYFIIPHFRGDDLNPFIERYGYLGTSPGAVLVGILTHPTVVVAHLSPSRDARRHLHCFRFRRAAPARRTSAVAGPRHCVIASAVVAATRTELPRTALSGRTVDCCHGPGPGRGA